MRLLILAALAAGLAATAAAETGVSDKEIVIGSCSDLDGPLKARSERQLQGGEAYFKHVNEQGGVNGRKLRLISHSDKYQADDAVVCFKQLLADGVLAGAFFVGTAPAAKHVQMAEVNKVPIIGFTTGARLLYEPFKKYTFTVRPNYDQESQAMVDHLWNDAGLKKIAVIYQEDAFGASILEGVKAALQKHGATPFAVAAFPRNTTDVAEAVKTVKAAGPEAVIIGSIHPPIAAIAKLAKEQGWKVPFVVSSRDEELIKAGGDAVEGVVSTEPFPPLSKTNLPMVAQHLRDMKKFSPQTKPDFVSLEGYADAYVLVEGLKRAGKDLTRETLIKALEGMTNADIGLGAGDKLGYGPADHKGLEEVFFVQVNNAQLVPFSDWKKLGK